MAHYEIVANTTYIKCGRAHLFYGVASSVKDRNIVITHDQDFMARDWTEHMIVGKVADTEDLPGGWAAANQIRTISHFDAAITITITIITTADVELVGKDTARMVSSCYVEVITLAPFITVYAVNWHRGQNIITIVPSASEEKVASLVTC